MSEPMVESSPLPWIHLRAGAILSILFWGALFGAAYTQANLYYSNQNQYFLQGSARAGRGFLNQDWLANTGDPTPVFSTLVMITDRFFDEGFFYLYYLIILGLYFHSLAGVFTYLSGRSIFSLPGLTFATLFTAVHSAGTRWLSAQACGVDYPWFLQSGVAGQYLLGFGLQPSVFGVFLLASINAFLWGRSWTAVILACLAGIVHTTYLLAAAMLVLAYIYLSWRRGRLRLGLLQGSAALVLVLPVVVYNLVSFAPGEYFAEAQRILVHERIPHHAEPVRWCDSIAYAQIAWMVLGTILVLGRPLFVIQITLFGFSSLLTLLQLATDNDTLALLFPWRTSAVLVPLATTIVLTLLVERMNPRLEKLSERGRSITRLALIGSLAVLAGGGLAISLLGLGYRTDPDELPLLEFVKKTKKEGEVYLLPVEALKSRPGAKGVFNSNFLPAPRRGEKKGFIAVDLQRFRLFTGAPIYVDFKSIPYKDAEVLEWRRRLRQAQAWYAVRNWTDRILNEVSAQGITHVVVPIGQDIRGGRLKKVFDGREYRVYRVMGKG